MGRRKKEEEVYHVEVITRARVSEDGDWEYLVKWAGYDSDADSWEPGENVQQCNRLLSSFWKHIGMDNEDYPIGYEVAASCDWIDKEKKYFEETFVKPSKRKPDRASAKKDRQETRQRSSASQSDSCPDDSSSSDKGPSVKSRTLNRDAHVVHSDSEPEVSDHSRKKVGDTATATWRQIRKVSAPTRQQDVPPATGEPSIIAPPKIAAPRTHQDQRSNPLVKSLSLPSKSVESGSSLSTKQRIAAGIPPPRPAPKPLPPAPKTSLSSLSFRKNKPSIPPSIQIKDVTTPSTSTMPTSPVVQPIVATNNADTVTSLQPMDIDLAPDFFDPAPDDPRPLNGSSEAPIAVIPPKSWEETNAEMFLETIDLPALSAPLETAVFDSPNPPTCDVGKIPGVSKIPKKWKWSGELYINTSEAKAELLCTVTIADPSGTSYSSHINLLLSSLDSLRISKLYHIRDLLPLLRACGKAQYFGGLESNDLSDEGIIQGLKHHFVNEGLAAAVTLMLDGDEAAVLVVFSGMQKPLVTTLQVPEQLSELPILVVLLPFLVSSTKIAGWRSINTITESLPVPQVAVVPHEHTQQAALYQAMAVLCFPKALLDFLQNSTTSRTYCIWPDQSHPELDTTMLECILGSTRAVPNKIEEDVRVVFIPNQYLNMLHTMPTLATKRINSPEIQFWTYGYSPSETHGGWRVREIYPLGGVVTFTSSALAEDLIGCYQLMSQIIGHPLWDCYLIPEVLAVSHILCNDGDLSLPRETCLSSVLHLVDLGSVAVMRMPEQGSSNKQSWLSQIFHNQHSDATEDGLLEISLEILKSHSTTSGMTTEQLIVFTNNEITKDLLNAQIQPSFMESYRRFVVIRATSEDSIPFGKDGLEWTSLSSFSFKDDYFQS